jgi:hypothetical protein
MIREAYWITPEGEVIEVERKHINKIIGNPELFGLSFEKITEVYARYSEPLGLEGKAREEIMRNLILQGWIRIRWKPREWAYTVQMVKNEATEKNLRKWFEEYGKGRDLRVMLASRHVRRLVR